MAWHIPQEKMNNNPLPEEEVRRRFKEKNLTILDYTYKNNTTRMLCLDKNGYRVKVSLDSLRRNIRQYERFGMGNNKENFLYNTEIYKKHFNIPTTIVNFKRHKSGRGIDVKCRCSCGEEFWCRFDSWRDLHKIQCNKCSRRKSILETRTQLYLQSINIEYFPEYIFDNCKDIKPLPFDFYLPKYNMCIEVDGEGHFGTNFYKNKIHDDNQRQKALDTVIRHDKIKEKFCQKHNIKLLRLKYTLYRKNNKPINDFQTEINKALALY